jgi:cytochrome c peroxidase
VALPPLVVALAACAPGGDREPERLGVASDAVTGNDISRTTTNPNAQRTGRWLLDTTTPGIATKAEFTSPITSPDGRLILNEVNDALLGESYSLGVILAPTTSAPDYTAGDVDPLFMDRMLVRDTAGKPVLTPVSAPSSGPVWPTTSVSSSRQMALGSDPRLAGGLTVRISSTGATTNCFQADPASVTMTPSGPYECRRYLLFQPGTFGGVSNRPHMAQIGVVVNAYDPADPFRRLAPPTIVAAQFLSSFVPLTEPDGTLVDVGIEPSVTADGRLLVIHSAGSHFTFSDTPWDSTSWEPRRSLMCLATKQGTPCPGSVATTCADPELCGIADKPVCTGRAARTSACPGPTLTLRDKYPLAAYPVRNADGSLYQGAGADPSSFGGSYGWISFDGSEFFFNAKERGIRLLFGKATRGAIKHVDNQANVAAGRYCILTDSKLADATHVAVKDWHTIHDGDDADCKGSAAQQDGLRMTMPLGTGVGLWRFFPEQSDPLLPFSRRGPLFMMVDHNQLLGNFGQTGAPVFNVNAGSGEHRYRHIYSEVALDDFTDGDFVAYYHMNELVQPNSDQNTVFDRARTPDTSGNFRTASLNAGARFPQTHDGDTDLAGLVNPGYLGRAIYFNPSGAATVPATAATALVSPLRAFTIELAVKPLTSKVREATSTTTLVEMPGAWKLTLKSDTTGNLFPQFYLTDTSGVAQVRGNKNALLAPGTSAYTHLAVTVNLDESPLVARFYVDGALKVTSAAYTGIYSGQPTGTSLLVMGPNGTGPTTAGATEDLYLLDEVAISRKVRDGEYLAMAAFKAPTVGFDLVRSTSTQGPLLFSATGVLPATMRGLRTDDLRIPQALLDRVTQSTVAGETTKARFDRIVALGAALFNDDLLTVKLSGATAVESRDGRSCATCHVKGQGRTDNVRDTDINGVALSIDTPTSLNRAFSRKQFLDQRSPDLVDQVLKPVENTAVLEMGGDVNAILGFINGTSGVFAGTTGTGTGPADGFPALAPARPTGVGNYLQWFRYAFGAGATDTVAVPSVDRTLLAQAIAAFVISDVAANSNVDQIRAGLTAATIGISQTSYDDIVAGMRVFEGKGRCVACHVGSTYTDEMLHASGTAVQAGTVARTKTPTLRKISKTAPYFRDGSKATLTDVVNHYNTGGCTRSDPLAAAPAITCDPELYPLGLTTGEVDSLVAFLGAL